MTRQTPEAALHPLGAETLFVIALGAASVFAGMLAVFAPRGLAPVAGLAGLGALIFVARADFGGFLRSRLTQLILAALVWMLASALWAIKPADAVSTLHGLGPLLLAVALLAYVGKILSPAAAARCFWPVLAGFILLGACIVTEWFTQGLITNPLVDWGVLLKSWELATTNRAIVLATLGCWSLAIMLARRGWRLAGLVCIAISFGLTFCGILLTARVAMIAGIAVFLITLAIGRRSAILTAIGIAVLVLAMPWLPAHILAPEHFEAWLPDIRFSGLHRLYIWQFAAERIAEHPFIGWGLDASRSMPGGQEIIPVPGSNGPNMPLHPHNGIMQVWVELGAVGAVMLAALLAHVALATRHLAAHRFDLAAALAALVSGLVFFSAAFGAWQAWWVGTEALAAGLMAVALRQPSNPPSSLVPGTQIV